MNLKSNIANIFQRMLSIRCLTLFLVWICMLDILLKEYCSVATTLGIRDTFLILPLVQSDTYFNKVMLIGVLAFFSNAPFMERSEEYVITRIGRCRWGKRNIFYIFSTSALLSLLLILCCSLLAAPVSKFSCDWGSLLRTLAENPNMYNAGFSIFSKALTTFTPIQLSLHIFVLDTLAFALIGMMLYAFSMYFPRVCGYLFTTIIIFMLTLDGTLPFSITYFSPFSWILANNWRYGTDLSKPNLTYIYTAYFLLLFILIWIAQHRIHTAEWKCKEES